MKKYIKCIALFSLLSFLFGCSGAEEYIQSTAKNGPFVKFMNPVPSTITGSISAWTLSEEVEAPSNNVASYELFVGLTTIATPTTTGVKLTTFPGKLEVSGSTILSTLSKTDADFPAGSRIVFYGLVTGKDGTVAKDFPGKGGRNVSSDFINWRVGTKSAYRFIMSVK